MSDNWTPQDLKRLKAGLAKAKAEKKEVFRFDSWDVYVPHVESLVKVLEARLKSRKE